VILGTLSFFDEHCSEKFGHRFFTRTTFTLTAISCVLIALSYHWHLSATKTHGDALNGLVLAGIGAIILIGIVIANILRTNWLYGIGGSMIQLPLFVGLTCAGIPILIVGGAVYLIAGAAGAQPVQVVNYEPYRFH